MSSNGPGPAMVGRSTARTSRERWLVVLGGVLAGLIAFGAGEAVYQRFRPALVRQDLMGNKIMAPTLETKHAAVVKNSALTFGVLGACLGICLGAAGGLARGSTRAAVIAGAVGAVLGSAAGAGLTLALMPAFLVAQIDYFEYDLIIAMAMHALIWGVLGAAAGLAFAVGEGDWRLDWSSRDGRRTRRCRGGDCFRVDRRHVFRGGGDQRRDLADLADPTHGPTVGLTWDSRRHRTISA